MDDQTRITKLESKMETLRESNARLQRSVDLLHDEVIKLRIYVVEGFEKLRDRIDQQGEQFDNKLADQRAWTEEHLKEIRASLERGFAERRASLLHTFGRFCTCAAGVEALRT